MERLPVCCPSCLRPLHCSSLPLRCRVVADVSLEGALSSAVNNPWGAGGFGNVSAGVLGDADPVHL